jgi:PIN domain nuclease of toxin-antitoxin system
VNYLLDTHTFMWWDSNASALSPVVFNVISDEKNQVFVSLVSIWEITIKSQIGKLNLRDDVANIFKQQEEKNNFKLLKIDLPHILKLGELPLHHRDPFDRMLIAQAMVEGFTLLSKDEHFRAYPVTVLC